MKKIINDPTAVVDEMLDGLAYIHSDLVYLAVAVVMSLPMLALSERACCRLLSAEQSLLRQHLTKSCRLSRKQMRELGSSW